MRLKSTPTHPFINGAALSSPETHLLHLLPYPTDLGDHGPALCGTTEAPGENGWVDQDHESLLVWENIYCSACVNRFRLMIVDEDPRLNSQDQRRWQRMRDEIAAER